MASPIEHKLEEQLVKAGKLLLKRLSSSNGLLRLLNRVESLLSRVEQSPIISMQDALSPSLKALTDDTLLRNADVDVKVAVASCISEIIRITAPEPPYDDDQMKEVFRLIISSFENLHDKLSISYRKRTSILEVVSKFKLSAIMLDLECNDIILEMFQHFLKAIRDHHPKSVFSCMKTIMIFVLEESEDISPDLLSPILASVKKDNEEVLPITRRLAESVLESCATILKPYLKQVVNTLGISLDDYSNVLVSICQDESGSLEQNHVFPTDDHMVDRENMKAVVLPQQDNPIQFEGINLLGNEESDDLDTEKGNNNEQKLEQLSTQKRGRKPSSLKLLEASKGSNLTNEEEPEKMIDSRNGIKDKMSNTKEYDEKLVGTRVKVWWPEDQMFYQGVVSYFHPPRNMHKIMYDDGEEEYVILEEERWEIIKTSDNSDMGEGTYCTCHVASEDLSPKKGRKTSVNKFKKEGKSNGGASWSKSKRVSMKSNKSKDGSCHN